MLVVHKDEAAWSLVVKNDFLGSAFFPETGFFMPNYAYSLKGGRLRAC